MWFEAHQTMPRHRKTLKLASLLGCSRREAVGLMWDLWAWGLDNADIDGKLHRLSAADIADAMDYPRKKGDWLADALIEAGYLDCDNGTYILHDWREYAGKLNESREKDRLRKEQSKNKRSAELQQTSIGIPAELTRKSDGIPCATVPLPKPNNISPLNSPKGEAPSPKRKNPSTLSKAQEALFNRFWDAYPRKESLGDAEKAWAKLNSDEALTDTIIAGIERAIIHDHRFREKQYIPHPASWLNGKDWLNEYDDTQEPTRRHRRVN